MKKTDSPVQAIGNARFVRVVRRLSGKTYYPKSCVGSLQQRLEGNLISYQAVIDHLKGQGGKYGKNFFDTLRTRHRLVHKPFIKPRRHFVIPGIDIKVRQGRLVYYLREIIPFLDEIIRLREEGVSYSKIKVQLEPERQRLEKLRKLDFADDERVKPEAFFDEVGIAELKFKDYFGWTDNSPELQHLHYLLKARANCAREYNRLTQRLKDAALQGAQENVAGEVVEREKLGRQMDYYHGQMESVIKFLKLLLRDRVITMKLEDYKRRE